MSQDDRADRAGLRQPTRWLGWSAVFGLIFAMNFSPKHMSLGVGNNDDANNFANAQTLAMDFDLDYSNQSYIARTNCTGLLPPQSVGGGYLSSPFVFLGVQIDRLIGHPILQDPGDVRFSWSKFGYHVGASVYFFAGLMLLHLTGLMLLGTFDIRLTLLAVLSTGLLFYVLQRSIGYLAPLFFCLALVSYASIRAWTDLQQARARLWPVVLCGVCPALILLVRVENRHALILSPAVVLVLYLRSLNTAQVVPFGRIAGLLGRIGLATVLALAPLGLFFQTFYGTPWPGQMELYSEPGQGVAPGPVTAAPSDSSQAKDWAQEWANVSRTGTGSKIVTVLQRIPLLIPLVLGPEFGLLWSQPALLLGSVYLLGACLHLVLRHRRQPQAWLTFLLMLAGLGFPFAITLFILNHGDLYGWRYMAGWWPLAWLGFLWLCADYRRVSGHLPAVLRVGLPVVFVALCVFGALGPAFFQINERLAKRHEMSTLGVMQPRTNARYVTRLLTEMTRPQEWGHMLGHRYPGLVVRSLLRVPALEKLAPAKVTTFNAKHFSDAPPALELQGLLLFLLWLMGGTVCARQAEDLTSG